LGEMYQLPYKDLNLLMAAIWGKESK
jgi:hypothetical protein